MNNQKPVTARTDELSVMQYSPSELSPVIAKETLTHATMNCELMKARMTVRAMMLVGMVEKKGRKHMGHILKKPLG